MSTDWSKIVFSEQFMHKLEQIAGAKIVGDIASKEEAATYVIEKLSENDWGKCKQYKGECAPTTFLYTLSSRLIVEYSRKKFGRVRPPEWLKRQGSFWEQIWKEICLERRHEQSVIDRHSAQGFKESVSIAMIIRTIKAKLPWCGVSNMPESIDEDSRLDTDYGAESETITDAMKRETYDQFLLLAQQVLADESEAFSQDKLSLEARANEQSQSMISDGNEDRADKSKTICAIVESLNLSAQEQLMLRLFYQEGLSHSAIARSLNISKHIPVRQNKKVLERLRDALSSNGIELE